MFLKFITEHVWENDYSCGFLLVCNETCILLHIGSNAQQNAKEVSYLGRT